MDVTPMPGVPAFEFGIESIALASLVVLLSGILSMLISRRTKFPYTPFWSSSVSSSARF